MFECLWCVLLRGQFAAGRQQCTFTMRDLNVVFTRLIGSNVYAAQTASSVRVS
jgi:hypothetical protein